MLRFINDRASFNVPPGFVDVTSYVVTGEPERRITVRRCPQAAANAEVCVEGAVTRLQQSLGAGVVVKQSHLRPGLDEAFPVEVEAEFLQHKTWTWLLGLATEDGPWQIQVSCAARDVELVEQISGSLEVRQFKWPIPPTDGHTQRYHCGAVSFSCSSMFVQPLSIVLEGGSGTIRINEHEMVPEELIYSDSPLTRIDSRQWRIAARAHTVEATSETFVATTRAGTAEHCCLTGTLRVPGLATVQAIGLRSQTSELRGAFEGLVTSFDFRETNG